jgi:hypothetical protein
MENIIIKALIKEAEEMLDSINDPRLMKHFGYSITLMIQELNKISDNSRYYITRDSNIEEIINLERETWNDLSEDNGITINDIFENLKEKL